MIKAFLKLSLFIIFPVILLIYVEPFNPVHLIRKQLTERFFVKTHQGTFFLLANRLARIPEKRWPQEFKHLATQFGYRIRLLPIAKTSNNYEQNQCLLKHEFVYLDQEPQILLRRVMDSEWVIEMTMEETDDEQAIRSTSGVIYLLEEYFGSVPESQWSQALEDIKPEFGIGLTLLDFNHIDLPTVNKEALEKKQITWITDDNGEQIYYFRLAQSNSILSAGPISSSGINVVMILSVIVILFTAISIGLLSWLKPLWRDLKSLDQKALAFGNGYLDSRVQIKSSSIAARLGQSFNSMANSVQLLIQTNQYLTNAVAHDLRTPLARLRFAFEILESEDCSEEEKQRYRKSVHSSIDSLDYLINQTLIHSRYSRIPEIKHFDHFNLLRTISDEVEQCSYSHEQIAFEVAVDDVLKKSQQWVDQRAMRRALGNLLSNAARYANSAIKVSFSLRQEQLLLVVEDDGPGIDPCHYEKVFQPFAQLDNEERASASGHGLGLAIVNQIALWHKGSVSAGQSSLGGARFELSWPSRLQ